MEFAAGLCLKDGVQVQMLIPRPTRCLGTIGQHDQIHGQTDMRLKETSQSGQKHVHNHTAITCVGPKDPKGKPGLNVAS